MPRSPDDRAAKTAHRAPAATALHAAHTRSRAPNTSSDTLDRARPPTAIQFRPLARPDSRHARRVPRAQVAAAPIRRRSIEPNSPTPAVRRLARANEFQTPGHSAACSSSACNFASSLCSFLIFRVESTAARSRSIASRRPRNSRSCGSTVASRSCNAARACCNSARLAAKSCSVVAPSHNVALMLVRMLMTTDAVAFAVAASQTRLGRALRPSACR